MYGKRSHLHYFKLQNLKLLRQKTTSKFEVVLPEKRNFQIAVDLLKDYVKICRCSVPFEVALLKKESSKIEVDFLKVNLKIQRFA